MSIGIRKFKKTKAGSIPEDWQVVKIKNVAETSSGGTPSRNNKEYFKGSTSWVKTGELTNKYLKKTEEFISKLAIKNSSAKVFPKGTILVAMYGATIGKMSILNIDASCNQACCSIIPDKSKASTEYIYYALEYGKPSLISMGSGGAQPNISQKIIKVFEFPLPEIVEQQKIAKILSTVDADIEKTDAIIKETQQLKKGLMEKLFTEGIGHTQFKKTKIGRIPEEWEVVGLKNTADIRFSNVDKKTLAGEQPVFLCNYLDVYNNDYITREINFMAATATEKEIKKFTLMKGDILLTKDSETPDDIAVPSVVIEDLENVLCGYHLAMLRPNQNLVQNIYLSKLLLSKPINNQFIRLAHGLTRFGLNISAFEKVIIPVPSLSEQREIASILAEVDIKIENEQNYKSELEQLKNGLSQVLLTGKVRVKV